MYKSLSLQESDIMVIVDNIDKILEDVDNNAAISTGQFIKILYIKSRVSCKRKNGG